MSVSYTAVTLIGCTTTRDKIYRKGRERVCNTSQILSGCKLNLSGMDYSTFKACPFCASPIWQNVETSIMEDGEDHVKISLPSQDVIIDIINSNYGDNDAVWYVGHIIGKIYYENEAVFTRDMNLAAWRKTLEPAMREIGLWNEDSFALYTILLSS